MNRISLITSCPKCGAFIDEAHKSELDHDTGTHGIVTVQSITMIYLCSAKISLDKYIQNSQLLNYETKLIKECNDG